MKLIAVSQRVVIDPVTRERRDALDQQWSAFLAACGFGALPIPNHPPTARRLIQLEPICGVLLSGGNDLVSYGGDAPERDDTERCLVDEAERSGRPVLGVCRGMQFLQARAGVPLQRVDGHVAVRHTLQLVGTTVNVNSFHRWGATTSAAGWEIAATAEDGVVEAMIHRQQRQAGIMWHPERESRFSPRDIQFVQRVFTGREFSPCGD